MCYLLLRRKIVKGEKMLCSQMKELPSEKASHELTVAMHSAEDGD